MNEKFFASFTRIILMAAVIIAVAGSLAFVFMQDLIRHMPFSNF